MFDRNQNNGLSGASVGGAYYPPELAAQGMQAGEPRAMNLLERVHNLEQRADSGMKMTQDLGQLTEQRLRRIEQVLGL